MVLDFTYDNRAFVIDCKEINEGYLQVKLQSEILKRAAATVLSMHREGNGAYFRASYADLHTRVQNEPKAQQGGPVGACSSIIFNIDGECFGRLRIPKAFNIDLLNTQNAWWFIDTNEAGESGPAYKGRLYGRFLENGQEVANSLDQFYNHLRRIHHLQLNNQIENHIPEDNVLAHQGEEMQLNTIKYGPPGTGKTYSLVNDIKFLFQLNEQEDETEISSIADLKHVLGHQIEFLTFHQSYSYEDFIEGIKAEITETQQVNYAVKNGIFKKISRRAFLHKLISVENSHAVTEIAEKLIQLYAENTDKTLNAISQNEPNGYARIILNLINNARNTASSPDTPKYVLCIDEINRGNLSRIFGELITCIEKTKRHGGGETIPVTLPYSGDLFVVPDNLYIIGTMNTADRSLVKLDNAMRRRFNFQLIKPDASLLETTEDGVNLENFLNVVNGRIRERLGIDFELGHAYFMGINNRADFEMVIKNNIIPLLNEYFFNNNASVQEILQNTGADQYLDR